MSNNKNIRWEALTLSLALPLVTGFAGSLVTTPNISSWYQTLTKPFFNPPNWLFGPVWTTLYLLMGLSAYLIFHKWQLKREAFCYYKLFVIQLFLNFFWSLFFFGLKQPGYALVVILVLLYYIICLIKSAWHLQVKPAAYLLYPYLAWVSFAALLNASIWYLN